MRERARGRAGRTWRACSATSSSSTGRRGRCARWTRRATGCGSSTRPTPAATASRCARRPRRTCRSPRSARDGGLLAAPVVRPTRRGRPGERFDVVVDFARYPVGTEVTLVNSLGEGSAADVMRFRVMRSARDDSAVPERLAEREVLVPGPTLRTFQFERGRWGPRTGWTINGTAFDPTTSIADIPLGEVERWRFVTDVHHPVHVHLDAFQVLRRGSGGPGPVGRGLEGHPRPAARRGGGGGGAVHRARGPVRAALPQPGARGHGHDGHDPHGLMQPFRAVVPSKGHAALPAGARPRLRARHTRHRTGGDAAPAGRGPARARRLVAGGGDGRDGGDRPVALRGALRHREGRGLVGGRQRGPVPRPRRRCAARMAWRVGGLRGERAGPRAARPRRRAGGPARARARGRGDRRRSRPSAVGPRAAGARPGRCAPREPHTGRRPHRALDPRRRRRRPPGVRRVRRGRHLDRLRRLHPHRRARGSRAPTARSWPPHAR